MRDRAREGEAPSEPSSGDEEMRLSRSFVLPDSATADEFLRPSAPSAISAVRKHVRIPSRVINQLLQRGAGAADELLLGFVGQLRLGLIQIGGP